MPRCSECGETISAQGTVRPVCKAKITADCPSCGAVTIIQSNCAHCLL